MAGRAAERPPGTDVDHLLARQEEPVDGYLPTLPTRSLALPTFLPTQAPRPERSGNAW
jgi:hypothetical protein